MHNLAQSLLLFLSPPLLLATIFCSLSPTPSPLCCPAPPSIFCYIICRYISPRGSLSVLPSVWGNAAHLWRPQLSAQSLFLFLYLLANPAAHYPPTSLHTPGLSVLTSSPFPLPGSAQPHTVGPAQPLSPHALPASSAAPAQRPLLLSTHAL